MRSLHIAVAVVILLTPVLAWPALAETSVQFSAYPSYSAKFDIGGEKFSLITSMVVYNISGETVTDVTFKQVYPEGVTVAETYQRDAGTEATGEQSSARRVEENTFYATLPEYRNRQYVVVFNELVLARRLNQITFPGLEISYTDPEGNPQTARLPDNSYDLFRLSNVVGGLERFLKKYNRITFDFKKATPDRTEWEFAPKAASAEGRFPTGIIETNPQDRYSGYFRIRSGPPGDNIQILVAYEQTEKDDILVERDAVMDKLHGFLRWCGEFEFMEDGLEVTQGKWKKYKNAWSLAGRWRDTIKDRLGEGPFQAKVFYGPREDVEYYVLGLVHGRGLGAEGSVTPNPEKEAQLTEELTALMESFRSSITPLSTDRR